jgi:long-chain acyl-CoA synthetase
VSSYRYPAVDYDTTGDLLSMFLGQADRFGEDPLLWGKVDGVYQSHSWASVRDQVAALSQALVGEGLQPGDRVVLASENRPDWTVADLAILAAGALPCPAYPSATEYDYLHVLDNVEAAMAIVSDPAIGAKIMAAAQRAKRRPLVVMMDHTPDVVAPEGIRLVSWNALMAQGEGKDLPGPANRIQRDDLATVIHTSGTGGAPKGVKLSHRAILHNCMGAYHLLESIGLERETFLSFLPLCHSYEHTTGLFFPISLGAQVYFAEGVETLATNMLEARPTIMTAVPRLYEMMRARILRGIEKEGGKKKEFLLKAVDLGTRRMTDPKSLGIRDRLFDLLLDKVVRAKVQDRFGGRLKALVSGGGPLNTEVGYFFRALGVPILQGYGLTETAPVVSCNLPYRVKMHTVGPAFKGVEVKIAEDDGEILVRGPLVMDGYWNDEEATREVIDAKGWLHTGDVGRMDEDGFIQITDRKKDLIVNSGGQNISPQRVEGVIALEPEIGMVIVFGDKMPHLVALIVPAQEFLTTWAREHKKPSDLSRIHDDPDLKVAIAAAIDRANAKLTLTEKVRRFTILSEPPSVENNEMTPTMKARRFMLRQRYAALIEGMVKGG